MLNLIKPTTVGFHIKTLQWIISIKSSENIHIQIYQYIIKSAVVLDQIIEF